MVYRLIDHLKIILLYDHNCCYRLVLLNANVYAGYSLWCLFQGVMLNKASKFFLNGNRFGRRNVPRMFMMYFDFHKVRIGMPATVCKIGMWVMLPLFLMMWVQPAAMAQPTIESPVYEISPRKAFVSSLVLPGLGHRHVQQGSWRGWATLLAAADVSLWLGLVNANWQRNQRIQSYETLAISRAGADLAGKDRTYYLNLATYLSSDAYLDAQLRNRFWNRVDYVSDTSFQWAWESEEDFQDFRQLRDDAESFGRRRTFLIALLVGNRLISGISAVVAANRVEEPAVKMSVSLAPPPTSATVPVVNIGISF